MMSLNFKFPIDPRWSKRNWLDRWCARQTCLMLWRSGCLSYQFGGFEGDDYRIIMAPVFQLMHWILRQAGYDCCPADVMKRCGVDTDRKPPPEGTLDIFSEMQTKPSKGLV